MEDKDIGVHLEDQQVVGYLQLCLVLTTVAVLEADTAVELALQGIVQLRGDLQEGLLEEIHRSKGAVKNFLLEGGFTDDLLQNLLP